MLVPGFDVHRIPVELTNVNNVRYRHDGALITLGYNGDIHILRDTDGDGLEDSKTVFYKNTGSLRGPIGMAWTAPDDPRGVGCFVASKGKVSFFVDRDGDDHADDEVIVAQGWEEIPQNVDAVGLAIDRDGWLYFGLGAANYANAYLVDEQGVSKYDRDSDRGTIQRVSPDFTKRETVCTGVRFPIGMAFNSAGDLFVTDQEGATWLPNGNPFDELLHIREGKHYGFPPRHPKHNPAVIDEPSVFDYGPQHQSTCGMFFNADGSSPSHVGPEYWSGNAIVAGESRGKLYRTQLVKTDQGYIAQTQLLACLQMLTIDVCATPTGGMVVACHSGPPDWGTGPAGIGELFKIAPSVKDVDVSVARPVAAWFSSPGEIAIAFDSPLDPSQLKDWPRGMDVYAGQNVRAGDRYENLMPPYAVVKAQSMAARRRIDVSSLGITPDHRTLIVRIPPQVTDESYAVRMPTSFQSNGTSIEQRSEMEIDLAPRGVQASWVSDRDPNVRWDGVLPHWDLAVARSLTQGSSEHERLWSSIGEPGTLKMTSRLDLVDILRPKVQVGSSIDYEWPEEIVTLNLKGPVTSVSPLPKSSLLMSLSEQKATRQSSEWQFEIDAKHPPLGILQAEYHLEGNPTSLPRISICTNEDPSERAIPLHRFRLPGFEQVDAPKSGRESQIADPLQGGNWGRGRMVFRGNKSRCSACHNEPGSGATLIGPDLSNLVHRDYDSVLRDITHPSYAINPEYIGQKLRLNDGTVWTGVLRDQGGALLLGTSEGKTIPIAKETIEEMSPSATSTMPTGLMDALSEQERLDLLTYLLRPAPSMPLERPNHAPPVRTAAEVAQVLAGSITEGQTYRPLRIVLVAGPKDHGPNEHDYPAWLIQWGQLLTAAENITIDTAWEFPSAEQLSQADVLLFFQKGDWDRQRAEAMDSYFQRGGGALYLHWAVNGNDSANEFAKRIGIASSAGRIGFRHGPLSLRIDNSKHPILRNIERLDLLDESYWLLVQSDLPVDILASSEEDGSFHPQLWTAEPGKGRVLVSIPGHYSWTFDDPIFRTILLRGIAWTSREPIDRFNDLVPLGARMRK
jgi:putative heme-binding domain-containing protein